MKNDRMTPEQRLKEKQRIITAALKLSQGDYKRALHVVAEAMAVQSTLVSGGYVRATRNPKREA